MSLPLYIITTAYNAENYFDRYMYSVCKEILTLDCKVKLYLGIDHCEKTLLKAKEWISQNRNLGNNIKFFFSERNVGTYVLKNSLLNYILEDDCVVVFFDIDDIFVPGFIKAYYSYLLNDGITLVMDDYHNWANYLFAKNATIADKTKITLKVVNKTLTVPYYAKYQSEDGVKYQNVKLTWCHGNNYVVHGQNSGYLTVSVWGSWHTRNHTHKTLTKSSDGYYHYGGTSGNDAIYAAGNTKFNDKIYLNGGKDVVVYDKTKWGYI